jgi:hypothetical protein
MTVMTTPAAKPADFDDLVAFVRDIHLRRHQPGDTDPLLDALATQRDAINRRIGALLAYGRIATRPRPYKLADLATAVGMSVSGVRVGYHRRDLDVIEAAITH